MAAQQNTAQQNPLEELRRIQMHQRQHNRKLMDPDQDVDDDPDNSDVAAEDVPLRRTETRQAKPGFIHGVTQDTYAATRVHEIRLGYRETVSSTSTNGIWEDAGNAALELARILGQNPQQQQQQQQQQLPPLRLVKLLGAGGLGFVALFDARVENQGQLWDVNLYVCKGVLRRRVISSHRNDQYAQTAQRKYRRAVATLRKERENQDALAGNLHVVQSYNRAYRRQIQRHRLNQVSRREAGLVNRRDRIGTWNNRHNPVQPWNVWRGVTVGISSRTQAGVQAAIQQLQAAQQAAAQQAGPQQPAPAPTPAAPAPQPPARPYDQNNGPSVEHDGRAFDAIEAQPPEGLLLMEYLPKGDLASFVGRLNAANNGQGETPPNRVLWRIWHCFVHMIRALERPCKDRREQGGKDPYGPLELERHVPAPTMNLIHFDIDPRNILIGPFDSTGILPNHLPAIPNNPNHITSDPPGPIPPDNSIPIQGREDCHYEIPTFKLADFGLAKPWAPNSRTGEFSRANYTREKTIWQTRNIGKSLFSTPEQFSEEWDWVNLWPIPRGQIPNPRPPRRPRRNKEQSTRWRNTPYYNRKLGPRYTEAWAETPVEIAGQYSWKTNLYQFALTMFTIITGYNPPEAPIASEIIKHQTNNQRTTQRTCYTYGGYLLDDDAHPTVDRELRETLALCLAQKPADRPEYDELTAQLDRKLSYYQAVSDDFTAITLLGPPRPPFTEWAANLPNQSPPSERIRPPWHYVRNWSERRFRSAPPPKLITTPDYDRWLNGITEKQNMKGIWRPTAARHPFPNLVRSADDNDPAMQNLVAPATAAPGAVLKHVWYRGDYEYTVDIGTLARV